MRMFFMIALFFLTYNITAAETITLQNGTNSYNGCLDFSLFNDYSDNKPPIHIGDSAFLKDASVLPVAYYDC